MLEGLAEGGYFGAGEGHGTVIDEVGDVHAVLVEHPPYVPHRLHRGEVPRHADAPEGVADDQVTTAVVHAPQAEPAVLDAYVDTGSRSQTELLAVDAYDAVVDLGDQAARPGARGREIAGKVSPPPPRWWAVSGSRSGKAESTADAMARTYSNSRKVGSSVST